MKLSTATVFALVAAFVAVGTTVDVASAGPSPTLVKRTEQLGNRLVWSLLDNTKGSLARCIAMQSTAHEYVIGGAIPCRADIKWHSASNKCSCENSGGP